MMPRYVVTRHPTTPGAYAVADTTKTRDTFRASHPRAYRRHADAFERARILNTALQLAANQ